MNKLVFKLALVVFITVNPVFAQDVYLSFGEINLDEEYIPVLYESSSEISGGHLEWSGMTLGNLFGGACDDAGFVYNAFYNYVNFFNLSAEAIPPGEGILFNISYSTITANEICLVHANIFNQVGDDLDVNLGPCISPGTCAIVGDLDNNSIVDVLDVVISVQCVLTNGDCPCLDMDASGVGDISDILLMVELILGN